MVGLVQARDPATSSINYRCTTAGMTVILLGSLFCLGVYSVS